MIVCSCQVISDKDIEQALAAILREPDAPLPTPGVVYRQLAKKMVCGSCSPLAVRTIYEAIDRLAARGGVCPYACENARGRLGKAVGKPGPERVIEHAQVRREARRPAGRLRPGGSPSDRTDSRDTLRATNPGEANR
jgi:bacterioferritin-associated ferredoxin